MAQIDCSTMNDPFYERATFALWLPRPATAIAHLKATKLACGGLQGLQATLAAPVPDVHAMVQSAQAVMPAFSTCHGKTLPNTSPPGNCARGHPKP